MNVKFTCALSNRLTNPRRYPLLLLWVCFLFLLPLPGILFAQEHQISKLHPYIDNGGYALQVDGTVVRSHNIHNSFIPASTIKILTSLIALEILGPQYRFATYFFIDGDNNLYIKGEGDPLFVSENITTIADQLIRLGIVEINTLYLDGSAFSLEGPPAGSENSDNPYDAHSGAIAVNFNSLPFRVLKNGTIISGEKQTPLLPMMKEIGRKYRRGSHRVNVSAFPQRYTFSNIDRYTGELFTTIFQNRGIHVENGFTNGRVSKNAKLILTYESEKTVADLVRMTLMYSSNFIANQLYLSCGKRIFGTPATWEKSAKMVQKFISIRLQLHNHGIRMVDGSGLSPNNRISPAAMLTILNRFAPYAKLLKQKGEILLKSGTFTGTYCYSGYFQEKQRLTPFVLFLNQHRNTRKKILRLLHKEFNTFASQ